MTEWILAIEGSPTGRLVAMLLALLAAVLHAVFAAMQKGRIDPWVMRGAMDASYGLMALPFALRVLMPAVQETYSDYLHLRMSLGMGRWIWMTRILGPRMRRPIGFSAGLAAALSMGDLGVIALFADPDLQTLPLMLYRLMGAYRMDQAAATAVVLVVQSLFLFWMFDRGGRGHAAFG